MASQGGSRCVQPGRRGGVYWGGYAEQAGILRVSVHLLSGSRRLGLSDRELLWTLHVLSYQMRPDQPPFPGHALIARQMGISERTSKRCADSLARQGLLLKIDRGHKPDGRYNSKGLDFTPLFTKVDQLAKAELLSERPVRFTHRRVRMKSEDQIEANAEMLNNQFRREWGRGFGDLPASANPGDTASPP